MKNGSKSRPKKLEKISFEELMGAAGMSGFGALLEQPHPGERAGWQPPVELRLKFSLRRAALAEKLGRQNDVLRSLNEPLTRRVTSLKLAIGILSRLPRVSQARLAHPAGFRNTLRASAMSLPRVQITSVSATPKPRRSAIPR
jgi:hypothetical protein